MLNNTLGTIKAVGEFASTLPDVVAIESNDQSLLRFETSSQFNLAQYRFRIIQQSIKQIFGKNFDTST